MQGCCQVKMDITYRALELVLIRGPCTLPKEAAPEMYVV